MSIHADPYSGVIYKYMMRLYEFSSLTKFSATVKIQGNSVKTFVHAESDAQARLLLKKMFGKDAVQSVSTTPKKKTS